MPKFVHHELRLLNPGFESPLIDVLTELEHLRKLQVGGTTPVPIFLQLKNIFHMLESLGSARIEGNHTTLADYVESRIDGEEVASDQIQEIVNIETAMDYVDEAIAPGAPVSEHLIREWHKLTVSDLQREGDRTPGNYRSGSVTIRGADHVPPEAFQVPGYMEELVAFINANHPSKYDLIKVALAHHRFGWIHPFSSGNGRVVRLLTYALLLKYGFAAAGSMGRVLNPTAVFCSDRQKYYEMLARADAGDDEGLEKWCHYVLGGILEELRKLDRLTNFEYLKEKILRPGLVDSRDRELITQDEFLILRKTLDDEDGVVRSKDIAEVLPGLTDNQRTYKIKQLITAKMLQPIHSSARQYTLCFSNNKLLRAVVAGLRNEGFVPDPLNQV